MPQPTSLPELMEELKRRRKIKYRNPRLTAVYVILGLTILGSFLCFLLVASPLLYYFVPLSDTASDSSAMPSFTLSKILVSAGIPDAETDLRISDAELHRDGSRSWVVGKITNSGKQTYTGFTILYDLFDKDGKLIGSTYIMMGELRPGDCIKFSTTPYSGLAVSARMNSIMGG